MLSVQSPSERILNLVVGDEALKSTTDVSVELVRGLMAASIPLHRDESVNDGVPEELVRYSHLLLIGTVASLSHRKS